MTQFLAGRRRQLQAKGRPMVLRRLLTTSTHVDVSVSGYLALFKADKVGIGAIQQGDATVSILNDEIAATAWPGPPHPRDQMIIDGRTWSVEGATPVYEAGTCIGHELFLRGG